MDAANSLIGFFYNLVPGILVIFGIERLGLLSKLLGKSKISENEYLIFILAFGLFFGFLFQGFSSLFKIWQADNIFKDVLKHDNNFSKIKYFSNVEKISKNGKKGVNERERLFYTMNNYVVATRDWIILEQFSARATFWLNMSWVYVVLFATFLFMRWNSIVRDPIQGLYLMITLFLLPLFLCFAKKYMQNHYDAVLTTFHSITRIEMKGSVKKK